MSEALKELSQCEKKSDLEESEISGSLEVNEDFVLISTSGEEMKCSKLVKSDNSDTTVTNIAQHDASDKTSDNSEEFQLQHNAEGIENKKTVDDWDKELLVEQQYLDEFGSILKKVNNLKLKPKKVDRPKKSMLEYNRFILNKSINRPPSYYKFDKSTTQTLEKLLERRYVGPTYNVVGRGSNSVIIYAECPPWPNPVNIGFSDGYAVKIYKLGTDVNQNKAINKKVQREYEHLKLLQDWTLAPNVIHSKRNIIIMKFIGHEQETALSISNLESAVLIDFYRKIVKDIYSWYNKYKVVHGNLCEKNLLYTTHYYNSPYTLYVIGWSHSVPTHHPLALRKLMNDCQFVTQFFGAKGVQVKLVWDLFKNITGYDKLSKEVEGIYKKDLWQKGHYTNPNRGSTVKQTRQLDRNSYFKVK